MSDSSDASDCKNPVIPPDPMGHDASDWKGRNISVGSLVSLIQVSKQINSFNVHHMC